jgi:DNA-binding transcriptional LysR family regulator
LGCLAIQPIIRNAGKAFLSMRIDALGLQAFLSIAERGSFQAAASHLNLSQTALSHRIRKLEDSLRTQLLLRTTRQVTLTPAGAALLPKARKLFEELDSVLVELRGAVVKGEDRLAIGCLPTIAMQILPQAISAFAHTHPKVHVKVYDSPAAEIAERVRSGDAEFGITIVAANRIDLELKPLANEPFVLVCERNRPIARKPSLTWAQIKGVPLIRISAETGIRVLLDDALGARSEELLWRYEVQRVATALRLVRSGAGAAIIPQLGFERAHAENLVAIPLRSPVVTRRLGIVMRKGAPLGVPARHFLKAVTAALRAGCKPVR